MLSKRNILIVPLGLLVDVICKLSSLIYGGLIMFKTSQIQISEQEPKGNIGKSNN